MYNLFIPAPICARGRHHPHEYTCTHGRVGRRGEGGGGIHRMHGLTPAMCAQTVDYVYYFSFILCDICVSMCSGSQYGIGIDQRAT